MKTDQRTLVAAVLSALVGTLAAGPAAADQCILDDLIVDGSACIGVDCVCNSEVFGFDTLRLKENNLRITFIDTSTAASFPRGDWQLRANESTNGGANEFAIDWLGTTATSGSGVESTPFAIEGTAPNNALYVDDGGRVGFGTATPSVELHVIDGDTPTLRLQQDGSAGFTPQTWDVAGNETNFFVRDVTSGSALPFRIRPGAPSNAIFTDVDGDVGMGTSSPNNDLHVRKSDSTATLLELENVNATGRNTGVTMRNSTGNAYTFLVNAVGDFAISHGGTGVNEIVLDTSDNVTIENDLTVNGTIFGTVASSRGAKTAVEPVDPRRVLAKVAALPMAEWSYALGTAADRERHLGPMAEDFHAAFGLGRDAESISLVDYSGVALAAIQGLNQKLEERDAVIDELEARLAALEAALAGE